MDKKNTIIGIVLIGLACLLMIRQSKLEYENAQLREQQSVAQTTEVETPADTTNLEPSSLIAQKTQETVQAKVNSIVNEKLFSLENNYIAVKFTNVGGAIKEVALKEYPDTLESPAPFIFNENSNIPALSISLGNDQQFAPEFKVTAKSNDSITFSYKTPEGLTVHRKYTLTYSKDGQDPYVISHQTQFINQSNNTVYLNDVFVHLGAIPPVGNDNRGEFLNFAYYNGEKEDFISVDKFKASSGFLGMGRRDSRSKISQSGEDIVWAAVKNQFFTSVLTPETPATGFSTTPIKLPLKSKEGESAFEEGITGSLKFALGSLSSSEENTLSLNYYIGPKEYIRLQRLGHREDLLMQFGVFGFISKILLAMLVNLYKVIPNYGVVIILVTILIKLLLWPLTAISTRSSKRMSQIQGPLKELRERFKDNPQKMQQETMKLFKQYKVNPAAGCLPILIQIPIFLGLFWMLRSASELRFASFLWIPDLSMPDTVAHIAGYPLNVLPLFMGVSMFFQMRLTPSVSTDQLQAKIFKFMPFIFLFICYNFPSGLVLYWTVQNLLTILQQFLTNRKTEVIEVAPVIAQNPSKKNKKGK